MGDSETMEVEAEWNPGTWECGEASRGDSRSEEATVDDRVRLTESRRRGAIAEAPTVLVEIVEDW